MLGNYQKMDETNLDKMIFEDSLIRINNEYLALTIKKILRIHHNRYLNHIYSGANFE